MDCKSTPDAASFRVASYNIRKCVGLDRLRSPERVMGVISALDTDVIALQEADKRLGQRPAALPANMIEVESDFFPVPLSPDDPDGDSLGWHGNALLLRKGTEVITAKGLHLPGLEPRGAIIADIRLKSRTMRIVGLHLGLMRRHRLLQLDAIRTALEDMKAAPTLLLGDFNEWSPHKGLETLGSDFTTHAPGRSYHAARPTAALDRIALGQGFELLDAGVHEKGAAAMASDHLPIWADVNLAAR